MTEAEARDVVIARCVLLGLEWDVGRQSVERHGLGLGSFAAWAPADLQWAWSGGILLTMNNAGDRWRWRKLLNRFDQGFEPRTCP